MFERSLNQPSDVPVLITNDKNPCTREKQKENDLNNCNYSVYVGRYLDRGRGCKEKVKLRKGTFVIRQVTCVLSTL